VYRKWGFVVLAALVAAVGSAHAMTLTGDANIVELLQQSSDIVVGKVSNVTDGIDSRGVPYTEVTLQVSESIRGGISGTYTFRQFGLVAPRLTADGTRKMMPAPEGFPRYTAGAELVLMLRPSARLTGFRMPAGVTGGKFEIGPGRVENERGNAGLFRNVRLEQGLGTAKDTRMIVDGGPPGVTPASRSTSIPAPSDAATVSGSLVAGCPLLFALVEIVDVVNTLNGVPERSVN